MWAFWKVNLGSVHHSRCPKPSSGPVEGFESNEQTQSERSTNENDLRSSMYLPPAGQPRRANDDDKDIDSKGDTKYGNGNGHGHGSGNGDPQQEQDKNQDDDDVEQVATTLRLRLEQDRLPPLMSMLAPGAKSLTGARRGGAWFVRGGWSRWPSGDE